MSKISGRLANKYAASLLKSVKTQLGTSGSPTPAQVIATELKSFIEVWNSNAELQAAMVNPIFEKDQRLKAILAILETSKLQQLSKKFIEVCFLRDRISFLPQFVEVFSLFADKEARVVTVEVITAKVITADEKQKIESSVKNQVDGQPRFVWTVDSGIIGGVVIRFEDKIIDGSISGKINRLEEQLFRASV
ncbi:MAG: ATP synthase F1 subunit delta [Proteobacteria bacterium]|nr:ATP synthase F1 subunit delta [Pseudomonadota bacterium]